MKSILHLLHYSALFHCFYSNSLRYFTHLTRFILGEFIRIILVLLIFFMFNINYPFIFYIYHHSIKCYRVVLRSINDLLTFCVLKCHSTSHFWCRKIANNIIVYGFTSQTELVFSIVKNTYLHHLYNIIIIIVPNIFNSITLLTIVFYLYLLFLFFKYLNIIFNSN